jgi:hypothetical protein
MNHLERSWMAMMMLTGISVKVEAAKLMRQAADILPSAPAMQIRYLEAMQAMAKSANSKVIFLPGASQTGQMSQMFGKDSETPAVHEPADFGTPDPAFQQAINARIIEHI